MNASQLLHEVAVTAIVAKDGKYLITRRVLSKKRFPGKWTVPGGRIQTDDYTNTRRIRRTAGTTFSNASYAAKLKRRSGLK